MPDAPANTPRRRFSRPRPRLRKAVKWGGLVFSIFLIAAWGASAWWHFTLISKSGLGFGSGQGLLAFGWVDDSSRSALRGTTQFYSHPPRLDWSFGAKHDPTAWEVAIPFWAITLPTIALTVFAWRRDAAARRRALHNHCPACGYDRAGLSTPDAACPECGAAAATPARP